MALLLTRPAEEPQRSKVSKEAKCAPSDENITGGLVKLTLNLCNTRKKDVTLELLVTELLLNVGEHSLDQLALLSLAYLSLVADVRVEDGLDISDKCCLLLEGECLVFKLGGLLNRQKRG